MKKLSCFLSIFIIFLVCLFSARETYACQCGPLPPVYETFNRANAVFIGKVVSSNESEDSKNNAGNREDYYEQDIIFDFEVIEKFKGGLGKKIKLNLGSRSNICYVGYEVGETYLIYLENNKLKSEKIIKEDEPIRHFAFCNQSGEVESTQDQIYFIREMLKGKPEPQIYGSVRLVGDSYIEGIKVVIESDKNRFETLTDKNGIYVFNNIPNGDYAIKLVPDKKYKIFYSFVDGFVVWAPKLISAKDYRGTAQPGEAFYATFNLIWNNEIRGRIVDSQGKPFKRYVAKLLPLSKANDEMFPERQGLPDENRDGEYWFEGKTPGKYVLAVDIYAPFENAVKKRFFFPQAESVKDAQIFDLTGTTILKNNDMKLPFTIRNINGEFVGENGIIKRMNSFIELRRLETSDDKINTTFDSENVSKGVFVIEALEGFEYWIHSQIEDVKAKPQKVKIGKEDLPLKIVFEQQKN